MALENAIRDPRAQIGGLVVLLDMAGLRFAHAKFLSPHLAKRSAEVIQDSFPMRFKAFHILHEPFYFDAILALIKPFMTEKIRNRVSSNENESRKFNSDDIFHFRNQIFILFFRFTHMVTISNRCIDTFRKIFYHQNTVEIKVHLTIRSGESRLSTMKITSFGWKLMAANQSI